MAQTELSVPGGATGADVFCVQAGDPTSGVFVETFLQTASGGWEKRSKAGSFKFAEKNRDDLMVELFDKSRSASVQIDFVTKTIREKDSSAADTWTDGYIILNATNQARSEDCVSSATRSAAIEPSDAGADELDAVDEDESKAVTPSKRRKAVERPSKRRNRAKRASKREKAKRTSKRTRAKVRTKKKSGSGFSIGIGGGGLGIGF